MYIILVGYFKKADAREIAEICLMIELKERLYQFCINYVQAKIDEADRAIRDAQESSANETKSSAGDKYETGRAMAQQEIDRNRGQLAEAGKLRQALERIRPSASYSKVQPGSLVITNYGNFYLSISAGQIQLDENSYFAVSAASPIGMQLIGKSKGDELKFNGKEYKIKQVC